MDYLTAKKASPMGLVAIRKDKKPVYACPIIMIAKDTVYLRDRNSMQYYSFPEFNEKYLIVISLSKSRIRTSPLIGFRTDVQMWIDKRNILRSTKETPERYFYLEGTPLSRMPNIKGKSEAPFWIRRILMQLLLAFDI